jgi:pimeloyl-ACP methyl ester carboxylesterase
MLSRPIRLRSPALVEDPEQAARSRHHQRFRHPRRLSGLRRIILCCSEAVWSAKVSRPRTRICTSGGENGALQAAINWYRASVIAAAAIAPVSVPTLYIWGTADGSVGRRAAELTAEFARGPYRFVKIEGGGHFIVDQFPERIANLLVTHVQSLGELRNKSLLSDS